MFHQVYSCKHQIRCRLEVGGEISGWDSIYQEALFEMELFNTVSVKLHYGFFASKYDICILLIPSVGVMTKS